MKRWRFPPSGRKRREEELDEELQAHLRMAEADRIAEGEPPSEAASHARREFGSVGLTKELTRESWGGLWLERLKQDLVFGFRTLRRSPGFSVLALLCLMVGIGATTAVFSWIEGILLRPFPLVANEERMVALTGVDREGRTDVSWPDLQDLRSNSRLIDAFIAEHIGGATLSLGERAERITGSVVSSNYFEALGIRPILGRTFDASEDVGRNAHPVTVISYQAWKDRFRGDPAIIGKTQRLNGQEYTIIGVTPEGFAGTFVGYSFSFWVPASMEQAFSGGEYKLENRGARWSEGFAFLKPGVTIEQAQAEISAVGQRLAADYPETNRARGFRLYPLWQTPFNQAGNLFPTLRMALVVAWLVLLIACANVGNLLLIRSFARTHEMTIRLSVGAGRGRLLRQLLTEGLTLSVAAAAAGLLLAYWGRNAIKLLFPPTGAGTIVNLPARLDWRVLAASAGACLISTVLFALFPAIQASKVDLAGALRAESGGVLGGRGKAWIRSGLVFVQVSLAFILLVGAGLVLKSLRAMRDTEPGFSGKEVLTTWVDMPSAGYDGPRMRNFQEQLVNHVQALPGVDSAAWARAVPFSYRVYPSSPVAVDGFVADPGEQPVVEYNEVGPAYLSTMGIPLVSGREFTLADDERAQPVAVVNEVMARRFWRGEDPVGHRLQVKGRWLQVVGLAKNSMSSSLREAPKAFFYVPLLQSSPGGLNFEVRTRLGPQAMARALTREIKALDAALAPGEVITMREQVDRMGWSQRVAVMLLTVFGTIALLLSGIGLYGVMSYAVSQRTRELGLRMALGAGAADLLTLVMKHGVALVAGGVALGAAAALGLANLMGNLLYKVAPNDPRAFSSAFMVMVIASLAACAIPALRAARIDPVRALRG